MKNTLFVFLFLWLFPACSDDLPVIDTSQLQQNWTRSREEETPASPHIYRPSDYKTFPAARFREVFQLQEDGVCTFWVLAPNDAHYFTTGIWQFNQKKNILVIEDQSLDIRYRFKVLELSENLLRMDIVEP